MKQISKLGTYIRGSLIVFSFFVAILLVAYFSDSDADDPSQNLVIPSVIENRIVVESEFRWPDPALSEGKTSNAALLRDKVSGDCFIYLWSGMSSGGAALSPIKCDNSPSILVPQFIIEGSL